MNGILKKIIGGILIIIGIIGLFLPIIQGILLIVAGGVLMEYKPLSDFLKIRLKGLKKHFKCNSAKKRSKGKI